jgi:cellulose synthase/poly-beta-1,6-N-acetylglucosamine synthase-like glycosyltransferase
MQNNYVVEKNKHLPNQYSRKKIAFCITCMNRLSHLQETLIENIEDNLLISDVEFILLDYNSSDGLENWVKSLTKYLDNGILTFYRTDTPIVYHRSHSRNMAIRLSEADIVCNLDADNFLGKNFANTVIGCGSDLMLYSKFIYLIPKLLPFSVGFIETSKNQYIFCT